MSSQLEEATLADMAAYEQMEEAILADDEYRSLSRCISVFDSMSDGNKLRIFFCALLMLNILHFLFLNTSAKSLIHSKLNGNTMLHKAIKCSKIESVEYLMFYGSDPSATDADKFSAFELAEKNWEIYQKVANAE